MKNEQIIRSALIQKEFSKAAALPALLSTGKRMAARPGFARQAGTALKTPFQYLKNPGKRFGKQFGKYQDALRRSDTARRSGLTEVMRARRNEANVLSGQMKQTLNRAGLGGRDFNSVLPGDVNQAWRAGLRQNMSQVGMPARLAAGGIAYGAAQGAGYGMGMLSADRSGQRQFDHMANLGFGDRLMALTNPQQFAEQQRQALHASAPQQGFSRFLPGMGGFRAGANRVDRMVTNAAMDRVPNIGLGGRLAYMVAPQFTVNQVQNRLQQGMR